MFESTAVDSMSVKWLGKLREISGWVVRSPFDAKITNARGPHGIVVKCSEQMIPGRGEESEIHIAFPSAVQMMEPVGRCNSPHLYKRPNKEIHVRMLQEQLHGNSETEEPGNMERHAKSKERQTGTRKLKGLVERVLHETVEPVHPLDGVVNRVEPPE